uniref:Dephospho-CoA kinase n=1 Tax=Parascaris equorum TaxID=6256 RepID=A0A914RX55_PAREQ
MASVVQPGMPAYQRLRAEFGDVIFDDEKGGILIREKLAELVFSDDQVPAIFLRLVRKCDCSHVPGRLFSAASCFSYLSPSSSITAFTAVECLL